MGHWRFQLYRVDAILDVVARGTEPINWVARAPGHQLPWLSTDPNQGANVTKRYANQASAHRAAAFFAFWYGATPPTPEL